MKTRWIILLLAMLMTGTTAQAQHKHKQGSAIELNGGQKWQVDANMMTYIQVMEKEQSAFKGETLQEYKAHAAQLQKSIDGLTSNCTMKGKAHYELHKWLLPYIDKVNSLQKAQTKSKAQEVYGQLTASFSEFHRYFE